MNILFCLDLEKSMQRWLDKQTQEKLIELRFKMLLRNLLCIEYITTHALKDLSW